MITSALLAASLTLSHATADELTETMATYQCTVIFLTEYMKAAPDATLREFGRDLIVPETKAAMARCVAGKKRANLAELKSLDENKQL